MTTKNDYPHDRTEYSELETKYKYPGNSDLFDVQKLIAKTLVTMLEELHNIRLAIEEHNQP